MPSPSEADANLAERDGSIPWWVGALPIIAIAIAHSIVILTWGTLPADRQPAYVRWIGSSFAFAQVVIAWLGVAVAVAFVIDAVVHRSGPSRSSEASARNASPAPSRRHRLRRGVGMVLLSLLVCVAGARYFSSTMARFGQWTHAHDSYHYLVNAKHYAELGYFRLYECTIEAAPKKSLPNTLKTRDLRTYEIVKARKMRQTTDCPRVFGRKRWGVFKADVKRYLEPSLLDRGRLQSAIHDLGFNGTPVHSFFASRLVRNLALTKANVTRLVLVDVWVICGVGVLVCWGFGARVGLLYMAFAFVLAADRYAIIGGSYFRYVWLGCLVAGVVFAWRRRWGTSAAFLTAAATLNVFPVLVGGGAFLALAGDAWRRRQLTFELRRFLVAGALSLVVLGSLGAAHGQYARNYAEFREKMEVHLSGSTTRQDGEVRGERLPGFGVSLKMAVARAPGLLRGGKTKAKQLDADFKSLALVYRVASVAMLVWVTLLAWRMRPFEAAALFGFVATYASMTLLGYYYAFASVVLLPLFAPDDRLRDASGADVLRVAFVAANAVVLVGYAYTMERFALYHLWLTYVWLGFILLMLAWYTWVLFGPRGGAAHTRGEVVRHDAESAASPDEASSSAGGSSPQGASAGGSSA